MANDSNPALVARYGSVRHECMIPLGGQGRGTCIYITHISMIMIMILYIKYMSQSMIAKVS